MKPAPSAQAAASGTPIQAFSIETAGTFDRDSELELYFSGLGKVRLEFSRNFNLSYVAKVIGWAIL